MTQKTNIEDLLRRFFKKVPKDELEAGKKATLDALKEALRDVDTSLWTLSGDGWTVGPVDQREFEILSAVALLNGPRQSYEIFTTAATWVPELMLADVYKALARLQEKGFVQIAPGESEETGRYQATEEGQKALRRARAEGKVLEAARASVPIEDGATEKPKP